MDAELKKISITLKRPDLQPKDLPVKELLDLLVAYEAVLRDLLDQSGIDSDIDMREMHLRLVGVREGSAVLECLAPEPLANNNETLREFIENGRPLPPRIRRHLKQLAGYVRRNEVDIWFESEGRQPLVIRHEWKFPKRFVRGDTVIYGRCLRVGGRRASVTLQISEGRPLTVIVSEKLAKEIALRLYEEIGIRGEAKWDIETGTIVAFKAVELLPYRKTSPREAIEKLREVAGSDWRRIEDVEKTLRLLRGSEEGTDG